MVMKLLARLFWRLPEPSHTILGRITGGWRVVRQEQGTIEDSGEKVTKRVMFRWECWPYTLEFPHGQRPVEWSQEPW